MPCCGGNRGVIQGFAGNSQNRGVQSLARLMPQRLADLSAIVDKLGLVRPELEAERANFVPLILENPNYFGTLEGSAFQPVKPLKFNTTYEELVCVGLQPDLDRLEAVI